MAVIPPRGRVKLTASSSRLPPASQRRPSTDNGRMEAMSRNGYPANRAPMRLAPKAAALMASVSAISTMPSPSASW